jgi:hypothetical protein
MNDGSTCEYRRPSDLAPCKAPSVFRVQVGTRKADVQLACARHLARTCLAMAYGDRFNEDAPPKALTVAMIGMF